MSDHEPTCHACDDTLTAANESRVSDTCADCLADCLCFVCREVRWEMAAERAADVARMAWGAER